MKSKSKNVKVINCEDAIARFNDFLDRYLPGKKQEELMAHIAGCKHCFERLEFEQDLKSKIRRLADNNENQEIMKRIQKLIENK